MNDQVRAHFPAITDDLLKSLEKLYPRPCPTPGHSLDKLMYEAGQASVTDGLREIQKWQKTNKQIGV